MAGAFSSFNATPQCGILSQASPSPQRTVSYMNNDLEHMHKTRAWRGSQSGRFDTYTTTFFHSILQPFRIGYLTAHPVWLLVQARQRCLTEQKKNTEV